VKPPEPPPSTPPDTQPPDPGVQASKELQARLDSAKKALAQCKLDKAADDLSPLKKPDGTWPPEVQAVVTEIETEKQVLLDLSEAQKALDAKQLDEADRLLARADITTLNIQKRDQLHAALVAARKASGKVEPPRPPPTTPQRPPLAPNSEEEATAAYDDAVKLFRGKQYDLAVSRARRCVELKATHFKCHLLLGSSFARLTQWENAATHYREFLKLAPADDTNVPRVRESLDNYEKSKGKPSP
jgi:tetratricopeptide (TPR) repeat protein